MARTWRWHFPFPPPSGVPIEANREWRGELRTLHALPFIRLDANILHHSHKRRKPFFVIKLSCASSGSRRSGLLRRRYPGRGNVIPPLSGFWQNGPQGKRHRREGSSKKRKRRNPQDDGVLVPQTGAKPAACRLGVRQTGFQPFYAPPVKTRQTRLLQWFAGFAC